ncbi:uncharacterized protein [Oscarella lobularis]|uniref:uncharacterized protein isoform X2 n=1 Tax=Oscarella lobularis TaxID=121494 RepID=UPI003313694B
MLLGYSADNSYDRACTPYEATRQDSTEDVRCGHPVAVTGFHADPYYASCMPDEMASTGANQTSLRRATPTVPSYAPWNAPTIYNTPPSLPPFYHSAAFPSPPPAAAGPHHGWGAEMSGATSYYPEMSAAVPTSRDEALPQGVKLPQRRGATQLWEFLLDLLNEEGNESVITWIDEDALTFRVLDPDELARRWGVLKARPKMNYDKLSRSLRYYYQKKLLTKIASEKYVYKLLCHPNVLYASLGEKEPKTSASRVRGKKRSLPHVTDTCESMKRTCDFGSLFCETSFSDCALSPPPPPPSRVHAPVSAQFQPLPFSGNLDFSSSPKFPASPIAAAIASPLSSSSSAPSPQSLADSDETSSTVTETLKSFIQEIIESDGLSLSTSDDEIEEGIGILSFDNEQPGNGCSLSSSSSFPSMPV